MRKFLLLAALAASLLATAQNFKETAAKIVNNDTVFTTEEVRAINALAVESQYPNNAKALKVYQDALARQLNPKTPASKVTWLNNGPGRNWFLSIEGGANALFSEDRLLVNFKDKLSYTGGLALGKWFHPAWGLRLHVTAGKLYTLMGPGSTLWFGTHETKPFGQEPNQTYAIADDSQFFHDRFFDDGKPYNGRYLCNLMYGAAGIDFLVNVRNVFAPYKPNAIFNPVLYAGIGYAHTFKDGHRAPVHSIMQNYGLQLNFRVAKPLDIYLEAEGMIVPEVFDRMVSSDKTQDVVASLKIGLTYNFGWSKFIKAPMGPRTVAERAPELDQSQIDALNAKIKDLEARLAAQPVPVPVPPAVKDLDLTPVFFALDKFVVRPSEIPSIERAVTYLRTYPDSRLFLTGFADVQTGNPRHNLWLSKNRVNAVADVMVKKYGIDRNRLVLMYKGDTVQPMDINELNRVVLFFR